MSAWGETITAEIATSASAVAAAVPMARQCLPSSCHATHSGGRVGLSNPSPMASPDRYRGSPTERPSRPTTMRVDCPRMTAMTVGQAVRTSTAASTRGAVPVRPASFAALQVPQVRRTRPRRVKTMKPAGSGRAPSGATSAASQGGELKGSAPSRKDGSSPISSRWASAWQRSSYRHEPWPSRTIRAATW